VDKNIYLEELIELKSMMKQVKNTPYSIYAKVLSLTMMNMHYERVAFSIQPDKHPYSLTKDIIYNTKKMFESLMDVAFIESHNKYISGHKDKELTKKHQELWQEIWDRHTKDEYREFIDLKAYRLEINNLIPYIKNKKCVDIGCGNAAFTFALLEKGASFVTGIDFGTKSIEYAKIMAKELGYEDQTRFLIRQVYDNGLENDYYDFAVSNGVFHHLSLENMEKAVSESSRILIKGGWLWYYIDGSGSISADLWDNSVEILEDVPVLKIESILKGLNVSRNKMVHLMDSLSATYIHSSYKDTVDMLSKYEFTNFRRLAGGTATDLDNVESDPFSKEKFGEGDLRILAQKKE